jgi:hypothetical protein
MGPAVGARMRTDRGSAERIRDVLRARVADDFTLDELAREVSLSRAYVVRAFRRVFQLTPYESRAAPRSRSRSDLPRRPQTRPGSRLPTCRDSASPRKGGRTVYDTQPSEPRSRYHGAVISLKAYLHASGRASAILLIGLTILFDQPRAGAVDAVVPGDWPPIKPGIWKIETTHVFPRGKTKHSGGSGPVCGDASEIFMGYWGGGILEIKGCRYTPIRVASEKFKIVTECIVRGLAAPSHAETEVTMHGPEAFEMEGTVREGKKTYRVAQVGRRLSDCPAVPAQSSPSP